MRCEVPFIPCEGVAGDFSKARTDIVGSVFTESRVLCELWTRSNVTLLLDATALEFSPVETPNNCAMFGYDCQSSGGIDEGLKRGSRGEYSTP